MQLKRCTGAWWPGHVDDDCTMEEFYDRLVEYFEAGNHPFTAGAIALELSKDDKPHIQYYLEHKPRRPKTLADLLGLTMGEAIQKVRHSAAGSYDYCLGTGEYHDKPALKRYKLEGEPKLWGSGSGQKADLAGCVEMIVNGNTPFDILQSNPYAYTVHRNRIWNLYLDLRSAKKGLHVPQDMYRR